MKEKIEFTEEAKKIIYSYIGASKKNEELYHKKVEMVRKEHRRDLYIAGYYTLLVAIYILGIILK
ncbi:MAG: hypothetical protein ACOCUI_03780 [bacterium]